MPENTPVYGFTFPCLGETVDATDFATLANQVDAQLALVADDEFLALNRYNASDVGAAQTVTVNTETPLTNTGAVFTVPAAGVYLVYPQAIANVGGSTLTSSRLRVRHNAVAQPGFTQDVDLFVGVSTPSISGVMVVAAAGDTIDTTFIYFGTGTVSVTLFMSLHMIARIA